MRVFKDLSEVEGRIKNAVVTTGSFDGVHVGHKIIIDRLKTLAAQIAGESTLVTFHPHPRKVLYPDQKDLKLINSQEEKIELLSKTGLHNLVILPFTIEFSKTSSHDFITDILIEKLNSKIIIVGHNHHFGHNRSGDFSYLYELSSQMGFQVEDIPLKDIENETVSSTKIRKALTEGNIMRANAYLDHQFIISGVLKHNPANETLMNKPYFLITIDEEEKIVPPPGIYATNVLTNGYSHKAMTLIADDKPGLPKVYNFMMYDDDGLHDQKVTLYFHKKIRGKEIFYDGKADPDELLEAREDIEELIY
jgi:riboflavin kinase / FMN adenylyltransferase